MRVAIDLRLAGQRAGGIAVYAEQLCAALAATPDEFHLSLLYGRRATPPLPVGSIEQRRARTPAHHRWEAVALGLELMALRPDLIHTPDFVAPFVRCCPAVVTAHDLAFLHWPEIHDADGRRFYGQIHTAMANADHIIAVSAATRRDLCDLLAVPAERITVVPEAASPFFQPIPADQWPAALTAAAASAAVRDLVLGRRGPFLLTVGTIEPRKNLPLLLRAYDRLVAAWPTAPRLVLAGRRGWLADETFTCLARLTARERVDWLEGPSMAELRLLYNSALALAFPSRYEGFGLPAFEAMACGLPVLAADVGALAEGVAQAGWLLPPDDVDAWCTALAAISQDGAARTQLTAAGYRRVAGYSWTQTAELTKAVYRRVLARA